MNVNWTNPTEQQANEMASALAFAAFVCDMQAEHNDFGCPRCDGQRRGDILDYMGSPVYIETCDNCGWVDWANGRAVITHDVERPIL